MDYVHFAAFGNRSDPTSDRASNPCRYSSAVVEQLTCNQQVPSSTLGGGTTFSSTLCMVRSPAPPLVHSYGIHRPEELALRKAHAVWRVVQKKMSVQLLLG